MSITVWGTRQKPHEPLFENCPPRMEKSVDDALIALLKYELGYGGRPFKVTSTHVTVVTHVLACKDTLHFEGSEEDMLPIHQALYWWAKATEKDDMLISRASEQLVEMNASTFLTTNFAPLLIGRSRVRLAMFLAMDITDQEKLEYLLDLKGQELEDLVAAVRLAEETGADLKEVVEETAWVV